MRVSLCLGLREYTAEELLNASPLRSLPSGDAPVGLYLADGPSLVGALATAEASQRRIVLLPRDYLREQAEMVARGAGCEFIVTEYHNGCRIEQLENSSSVSGLPGSGLMLLTSGTEGKPKSIWHSWESLRSGIVVRPELRDARWLSMYPITASPASTPRYTRYLMVPC